MELQLKYGREIFTYELPEKTVLPDYQEPQYNIDRTEFSGHFQELLPTETSKLKNIAIIVSDKTRLCGYPQYLPWITEILHSRGVTKDKITFYIAYGTHAKQLEEESLISYGEVYQNYRFVHHNCNEADDFQEVGITKRGTSVSVRKDILNSSLLITFGAISHHYFAGFGGGRKLLFPGLASRKSVYQNHGLFLDRNKRTLAAGCQPGKLDGNPLAEDLKEIDEHLPEKISIHGILNASGKVCQLLIGKNYQDFEKACAVHDSYYRYHSDQLFDLVVASSGGYPKDINFIQAHKSVHHAAAFVRDGGTLVVLSECIDGIGSNYFTKFLEAGSFESAFSMLENNYEGNGGTALSMMQKTARIKIFMVTNLNEKECEMLNVGKISLAEVQTLLSGKKGSIAVIKNASILVK